MNKSLRSLCILIFAFAITMLVALAAATPAQVRVLMSGAFQPPTSNFCLSSRAPLALPSPPRVARRREMDPTPSALSCVEEWPRTW